MSDSTSFPMAPDEEDLRVHLDELTDQIRIILRLSMEPSESGNMRLIRYLALKTDENIAELAELLDEVLSQGGRS